MIDFGIDQFTLTLYVDEDEYLAYDCNYFQLVLRRFSNELHLEEIFGKPVLLPHGDGWYNCIYDFGFDNRHLYFKYNDDTLSNQMSIVFHAETLREFLKSYRNKIDSSITVFRLLRKLSTLGKIRLSRLDIAIDFIDEGVSVDNLAKGINDYDIVVTNSRRSVISPEDVNQIGSGGKVETLYINRRTSASFLRIYDKKKEVLQKDSSFLKTAMECENWTRIELELKKYYAHNITELILSCKTLDEFNKVILGVFLDKFKFLQDISEGEKDEYIPLDFYQSLEKIMNDISVHVPSHVRGRVTELERKYWNLENNGSMRLFRIIKEAYGEEGLREIFECINKDCEQMHLNRDHHRLIEQYKKEIPFFRR